MIKGILFDKDGTLIDFYSVWGTAAHEVAKRLCEIHGVPGCEKEILDIFGVNGDDVDPEGSLAWKSYGGIAEDLAPTVGMALDVRGLTRELASLFFEEVALKRREYPTFTDLKKLMGYLSDNEIRIGLATTDEPQSTQLCMECLGIADYISFWGTSGKGLPEKPDGRLIAMAADEWNIETSEIAVVGDTPNDMRFASNGKAVGVAALSGTGSREAMEPLADYCIASVAELPKLIEKLKNKEEDYVGHKAYACI